MHCLEKMPISRRLLLFWISLVLAVFIWSAIHPHDYFTWFLEVLPAMAGFAILAFTYRRFTFTPLVYWLICLHMIVLMVGGHSTYAEVPLFEWLKPVFGWQRNNYDKVGHFMQGFVPVMIAREILIRKKVVAKKSWLPAILILAILGTGAAYEIAEWGVSVATGSVGDSFLGTQGYVWDTQSDMLMCLIGSILALLVFSKWQEAQMQKYVGVDLSQALN
jgi:putative membrane protein